MSDDLRDQIGGILSADPVRFGPGGTADEIMTLFRPVLDAKDTEIERLKAERDEVAELARKRGDHVGLAGGALDKTVEDLRASREATRRWEASSVAAERECDRLSALLVEVLGYFNLPGHVGRPCVRTGWIDAERVTKWRAAVERPAAQQAVDRAGSDNERSLRAGVFAALERRIADDTTDDLTDAVMTVVQPALKTAARSFLEVHEGLQAERDRLRAAIERVGAVIEGRRDQTIIRAGAIRAALGHAAKESS